MTAQVCLKSVTMYKTFDDETNPQKNIFLNNDPTSNPPEISRNRLNLANKEMLFRGGMAVLGMASFSLAVAASVFSAGAAAPILMPMATANLLKTTSDAVLSVYNRNQIKRGIKPLEYGSDTIRNGIYYIAKKALKKFKIENAEEKAEKITRRAGLASDAVFLIGNIATIAAGSTLATTLHNHAVHNTHICALISDACVEILGNGSEQTHETYHKKRNNEIYQVPSYNTLKA